MKVTVVGTSCTWFTRNDTSYIIDDKILIDMPSGSYKSIIKLIDITKVKTVMITHFHSDHFADLHILSNWDDRVGKLNVYGPPGILNRLLMFNKICDADLDDCDKDLLTRNIIFHEYEDGMTVKVGGYNVQLFKMQHGRADTFGFIFEKDGVKVAFSADTAPCKNLEKMLENTDYIFLEMSSVGPHPYHISIKNFEDYMEKYPNVKFFPIHTCDKCQEYAIEHGFNYLNDGDILNF